MIKDLLLVIENNKGISERNMLSTKEEFAIFLDSNGMSNILDDVVFLLEDERAGFQWKCLNTTSGILEFRRCRDEQDLCDFLDGKYNDSAEKMKTRGLHSFGLFNDFQWEFSVSALSPVSISLLTALKDKNPALNKRFCNLFTGKSSLDDLIQNCSIYNQSFRREGHNVAHREDVARSW